MYAHIDQEYKCSQCGSIFIPEHIKRTRGFSVDTYIRCINCGHEKKMSTETWASTDEGKRPKVYNKDNTNKPIEY